MSDITQMSDEDLLRLASGGDQEAFAGLYRRHQASIFRFVLHMTASRALAEEVTQEVFVTLARGVGYVPSQGALAGYLFGIARNHILRHLQHERRMISMDEDGAPEPAIDATPLRDLTDSEALEALRSAISALPPLYREAVVLCDLEEMPYADAAAAIGVPIGTVRSRLNRGRELLVRKLKSSSSLRCTA